MAGSLSTDMVTQQFTDGSQLGWLWTQGTEVIQSAYKLPLKGWLMVDQPHQNNSSSSVGNSNQKQKSFKLNTIYLQDTLTIKHENSNQTKHNQTLNTNRYIAPYWIQIQCLSFYITEHHKIQTHSVKLQVQSQLNTISVNEILGTARGI